MKYQRASHTCGTAAIANALKALGKRVSMVELARLAHTTPAEGTDFRPAMDAIRQCGFVPIPLEAITDLAIPWLKNQIKRGRPAIICVDLWNHWVTVVGMLGENFVLFDPMPHKGTKILSVEELGQRWMNKEEGRICSGIAIKRKRRRK